MNVSKTKAESATHSPTSVSVNVKIEVEPNSVLHTSPERLEDVENRFISRYPIASAPTEIIAIAASPLIFACCPVRSSRIAQTTVIPSISGISLCNPSTAATAIAPNATWDRPSPIKENRFSTSVTPKSEAHKAINTPTTNA